jgi:YegS/Rv2252/BmrU family lipid kinase
VVVNPSKVDDLDAHREQIRAALTTAGWPEPLWLSTTPEDPGCGMTQQALDAGAEVVFACGGDGTVMACAAVLAGTDIALAVLPAGTGNLLANNLDLPTDVAAGVALATDGLRRRIDVGAVQDADTASGHGGRFTIMAGMGFDAQMLDSTPESLKKRIGWLAYVLAALRHLRHRPIPVRIRLDHKTPIRRRVRTVLVANVGHLHGGIPLLPDALADDGWLDIAVLTPRTLRHWLWLAAAVIGRRRDIPNMETFRARSIEILSNHVQPRQLDGDVITPSRSLVVTVHPNALLICAPAAPQRHSGAAPHEE